MKLAELAKELRISTESFIKFIQDFDLELSECINTNFEVHQDFMRFARENAQFLQKYEQDLKHQKSVSEIAEKLQKTENEVEEILNKEKPKIFDNGQYRSSVSTYGIDNKLGGDYQFVYDYFGKKTNLAARDFIGYRDLFFYISSRLEPFLADETLTDWGIRKPAGIILYGPPGSGKIFWANKIAEIIHYKFKEIRKNYLGVSFVDGNRRSFNDFLMQMMNEKQVLLFMDDFDEVMQDRKEDTNTNSCDEETKEIVMHHISHFEEDQLLMIGSAKSLQNIDKEIRAPGRFDMVIPVFPPNARERAEMILYYMTENLTEKSLLMQVLQKSKAHEVPYWQATAEKMKVFSNTMIVDFAQALKTRIRDQYKKLNNEKFILDQTLIDSALREASAKLTSEYLDQMQQFTQELQINNFEDFPSRIITLQEELQHYLLVEIPPTPIGFQHQTIEEQKNNQ